MQPPADGVGGAAQGEQVGRLEQRQPLRRTSAARPSKATLQDRGDGGRQGPLLPGPGPSGPPSGRICSGRNLLFAQLVGEHAGEVIVTRRDVESEPGSVLGRQSAAWARPSARLRPGRPARSPRSTPGAYPQRPNTNGKPVKTVPGLAQVDHGVEDSPVTRHRAVADQKNGIGRALLDRNAQWKCSIAGGRTPCARRARPVPEPGWVRDRRRAPAARLVQRHPAEQLDAPHRPPGRDRKSRNDLVPSACPAKYSTDGINATSSSPAASRSASRLGQVHLQQNPGARSSAGNRAAWRSDS